MHIFWRVTNVPDSDNARSKARTVLSRLPNVNGLAQSYHLEGVFRVTLYYRLFGKSKEELKEPLRLNVQTVLRDAFRRDDIEVTEDC